MPKKSLQMAYMRVNGYICLFRFANEKDLKDFEKLIGQKLTNKTKSAWHPKIQRGINANKIYIYEP